MSLFVALTQALVAVVCVPATELVVAVVAPVAEWGIALETESGSYSIAFYIPTNL